MSDPLFQNSRSFSWPMRLGLVLAVAFSLIPMIALISRIPLGEVGVALGRPSLWQAVWLSGKVSVGATLLGLGLAFPCGWWLARGKSRWQPLVRGLLLLPMVAPPVVGGAALLAAFGRKGLLGSWFPISLAFTPWAAMLAATFVSFPFMVLALEAGFSGADRRLEEAAATLGAKPWRILLRITLPSMSASLGAGMALTWARALGEFGATITFAGNLPGRTQTLPLAIYQTLHQNPQEAYLLSALLMLVSMVVLVAAGRKLWRP